MQDVYASAQAPLMACFWVLAIVYWLLICMIPPLLYVLPAAVAYCWLSALMVIFVMVASGFLSATMRKVAGIKHSSYAPQARVPEGTAKAKMLTITTIDGLCERSNKRAKELHANYEVNK